MQFDETIENELNRLHYSPKTISAYKLCLRLLSVYFPQTPLDEISFEQIKDYIAFLINRKKSSAQTIHQNIYAFRVYYNDILGKDYDVKSLPVPPKKRYISDVLTISEVRLVLETIESYKVRLALTVIYSAGLELKELLNLKPADVDFKNGYIIIKQLRNKGSRKAIIPSQLLGELENHVSKQKPTKWLIEGDAKGSQINASTLQRSFKKALSKAGINKNSTVKTLKYCYVKHLEQQGVPLRSVLQELKIYTKDSLHFYTELDTSISKVTWSPYEQISQQDEHLIDSSSLGKMLANLKDEDEKDYLLESVKCLNHGLNRPSVIFAWTAAIRNIHNRCMTHSLPSLNMAIKRHDPKAPDIKKIDDFSSIKDNIVLQACEDLGIFDKNEKGILVECLNLRNKCGHPGKYNPKPLKVAGFMEDLITIVFSKT